MLIITGGGHSAPVQQPIVQKKPVVEIVTPLYAKPIKKVEPMKPLEAVKLVEKVEPIEPPPLPVAPPETYANDYEWGNCTAYVASRKKVPNSMGDANKWHYTLPTTSVPKPGAIAQSTKGVWGHVALVEEVSNGMVKVSEMNVQGLGVVSVAWYPIEYFDNYIHV